jgi:hypothetical protein
MHVLPARAATGALALLAVTSAAPTAAFAQAAPHLVVEVRTLGSATPIPGAQVQVRESRASGATNEQGVLHLSMPRPGTYTVAVEAAGFLPQQRRIRWTGGGIDLLDFALEMRPVELPAVEARASRGAARLANTGFHQRRSQRVGRFVTRTEIDARRPARLSEMLRSMPGVQINRTSFSDSHASMGRSALASRRCPIQYFVDGVLTMPGFNIDDVPPASVEAVEVYHGAAQIPAEFNRQNALCGVIVIWTRVD